jgi:hypothetical protein
VTIQYQGAIPRFQSTADYNVANIKVGESVGLVDDVPAARHVIERTITEAVAEFKRFDPLLAT